MTSHLAALLAARLPKNCRVESSDVKVNVLATGLSAYPDGSVFCGEIQRDRIDANALTNPTLLFEVTSPSTEDYDRGAKLEHYQTISSLMTVFIVAQQEKRVTVVTRNESTWETRDYRAGDRFTLSVPALELAVDEIYSVLEGI